MNSLAFAMFVLERFEDAIALWSDLGITREVTASTGVAQHFAGETTAEWMARADQGLYQAKRRGRNRTMLAPPPGSPDGRTRVDD